MLLLDRNALIQIVDLALDTIVGEFADQPLMGNCVECSTEVQYTNVGLDVLVVSREEVFYSDEKLCLTGVSLPEAML